VDIELGLDGERIGAQVLQESLGELLDLLHDAAEVVGLDPQDWRVDDLRAASAHVSLAAPEGPAVVRELLSGVEFLRRSSRIPPQWSLRMVRKVQQLSSHPGSRGTFAVTLTAPSASDPVHLDSVVAAHAGEALSAEVVNLGSLRGRVDRWNEHSKRSEIGLSRDEGGTVTVKYGRALSERIVSQAVGRRIEVWGKVKRNLADQVIEMTAEDFAVLEDETPPVSIASLRGLYEGRPGDLSEWLQDRHAE
jgi:hypothetical protein